MKQHPKSGKKDKKQISKAVEKAMNTYEMIEESIKSGKMKSLFTKADVWRLLGGKSADSKEATRAKRDLRNLDRMGKVFIIEEETCPTCGHKLSSSYFSLQPFREMYDFME